LVKTIYMLLCATEHLYPTFLAIYFRTCCQNVFIFFPLPYGNLIISESNYSWCAVSVFVIPLRSWEGGNGHLLPPGNWV